MKKLKKWQKIVIGVLVALIVVIGGLKIFKRPILSAILNREEYAVFDCCCKMRRIAKHQGLQPKKFELMYGVGDELLNKDSTAIFIYSIKENEAVLCNSVYEKNVLWFCPEICDGNLDTLNYFISWDIINAKTDKYKVLEDAVYTNKQNKVPILCISPYNVNDRCDEYKQIFKDEFEYYQEIHGVKNWVINLCSY